MMVLTKPSGNIILGSLVLRVGEHEFGIVVFHQFPQIKKCCFVTYPCGLLHIMRYDNDRISLLKHGD